jgi:putative membrane protein
MRKALLLIVASVGLAVPALADGFGYGHMMNDGGGVLMWFLILLVVAAIIYFVIQSTKSRDRDRSSGETALDILKKRYARGEIGKEEFDEKKAHLQQ